MLEFLHTRRQINVAIIPLFSRPVGRFIYIRKIFLLQKLVGYLILSCLRKKMVAADVLILWWSHFQLSVTPSDSTRSGSLSETDSCMYSSFICRRKELVAELFNTHNFLIKNQASLITFLPSSFIIC